MRFYQPLNLNRCHIYEPPVLGYPGPDGGSAAIFRLRGRLIAIFSMDQGNTRWISPVNGVEAMGSAYWLAGLLGVAALADISVVMADSSDPFATSRLVAKSPVASVAKPASALPCRFEGIAQRPLSLSEVVERALCNNPQTREAWANARVQAAQVGVQQSAFRPSVSANAALTRNETNGGSVGSGATAYTQESAGLALSYLLYDFGGRDASLESARQVLGALNATQDATIQGVFLSAVQAYYQWFAARAAVAAAAEAEKFSLESLRAATARYKVGAATPADKLQAQTAYSQSVLNRITAEGNANTALGVLANAMGLDADAPLSIALAATPRPSEAFAADVARLIEQARKNRPDLAAAEAQVRAARANVDAARASGMPNVSLTANLGYSNSTISDPFRSSALGIMVSIPLFTGFNTTYRIQAAKEQVEARLAQRDRTSQQVALDVWKAYQSLVTQMQALKTSAELVASATQSEQVARGRYKAGAGTILDLLTAQSALASARQQDIQALYGWYIAKAALAQAMGQLDFNAIAALRAGARQP